MKFVTSQNVILKALMLVFGGIAKSPEHSIVKVKADLSAGLVKFETKNIDMIIKSSFPAEIEMGGEILVEFVKFMEIIKKLNQTNEVLIESKEGTLFIKNGKSKFSVKGSSYTMDDFKPTHNISSTFKIMSKKVLSLIDKTKFSIYPDDTRFNLNGILFRLKSQDEKLFLNAVSTDGHRLSFASLEVNFEETPSFSKIILPRKTALEIKKILDLLEDEEMEIKIFEKQALFSAKSFTLVSKLIDAEFPDYEKVIPSENTKSTIVARKDLITIVERAAAIYAASTENGMKLNFHNELLTISAKNKDGGEAVDEIVIESNFNENLDVNYNYVYLLEILNHISSEKVKILIKDPTTPALLKDESLDSYFYILMPMRF